MVSPYIKAALVTLAITLFGFFLISQLDAMKATELQRNVDELIFQSQTERAMFLYSQSMANSSYELCDYLSSAAKDRASKAYTLAEKIRRYEESNVVNEEYERISGRYYLANTELYLNLRAAAKYCGKSPYTTVLFFYRIDGECQECLAQGAVLDGLRAAHPNLRVFALPYDTDYEFINIFVRRHGISQVPSLVIDDKTVLQKLSSAQEIEPYIGKSQGG
jgi:hypothetical protein